MSGLEIYQTKSGVTKSVSTYKLRFQTPKTANDCNVNMEHVEPTFEDFLI